MALIYFFFVPSLKWWFGRFITNHEQAQRRFILSYKMLVDIYPWEYNKFAILVVVHNLRDFHLC